MIKVLDKFIADKIAAGEVIERPVSAVKELVENSIDAGARSVIVEIRNGGKSYIRVTDDGCGIPPEEAETAFLRHATSKISGIEDLDHITSLGFRGEALASISAVSKLTLVTRTHDRPAGIRLIMHGGRVVSNETAGANAGTTIVVEDLFYNTPARRKFMGSDAREGAAVTELIQQYAICYSGIRFMLIRNGETLFTTAGDGDTLSAIKHIYPDAGHADLIEINGRNVHGFISDPGTTRSTRKGQLFFVNGRLIHSNIVEKGLEKGYGGRVFSGFPIAVLFIDADPSDIDVNIHPGKREIKFLKADDIISDIAEAAGAAMRTDKSVPAAILPGKHEDQDVPGNNVTSNRTDRSIADLDPVYISEKTLRPDAAGISDPNEKPLVDEESAGTPYTVDKTSGNAGGTSYIDERASIVSGGASYTGEQSSIRDYLGSLSRSSSSDKESQGFEIEDMPERKEPVPFTFRDLIYKGYIFNTYIIMEDQNAVYMFDQHAAHERINYEKFTGAYLSTDQLPQPVLTPFTLNVSADVYEVAREMLEPLQRMGYDISDFGAGSFMIRGVPSYVTLTEAEDFARAYMEEAGEAGSRNQVVIDKLIMKSCKSSVKGGEKLSEGEIRQLISDLSKCTNPYACPHGRPTFVKFTKYEIEKAFRRK